MEGTTMARSLCAAGVLVLVSLTAPAAAATASSRYVTPDGRVRCRRTAQAVDAFFNEYFGNLSRCTVAERVSDFYTPDAQVFLADGSIAGRPQLEGALRAFCSTFGQLKFTPRVVTAVGRRTFFATLDISDDTRLTGPVGFSDAFTFRIERCGATWCARATHLVTSISFDAVQAALK